MTDHDRVIDTYIAACNETDPARRRTLVARAFIEEAAFCDPATECAGHAALDAMLQGIQAQFPGHRICRTGTVAAHHDCLRFTWSMAPEGSETVVAGTDVAVVAPDGRFRSITGFFDQARGA